MATTPAPQKRRPVPRQRRLMHGILDDLYELLLTPDRDLQVAFDYATWERIATELGEAFPRLSGILERAKTIARR